MKAIKWTPASPNRLSEAFSTGMQLAFVSPDGEQCHQFVHCKDYLHDAIRSKLKQKVEPIYGFQYDATQSPQIGLDLTRLLVANQQDKTLRAKISASLEFLNQIEAHLHFARTKAEECSNPPSKYKSGGVWYYEGSRMWMLAPPLLSMYTLLIRLSFGHTPGTSYANTLNDIIKGKSKAYLAADNDNLRYGESGMRRILKHRTEMFAKGLVFNYPKKVSISEFHNHFGIVGFSNKYPRKHRPKWFDPKFDVPGGEF